MEIKLLALHHPDTWQVGTVIKQSYFIHPDRGIYVLGNSYACVAFILSDSKGHKDQAETGGIQKKGDARANQKTFAKLRFALRDSNNDCRNHIDQLADADNQKREVQKFQARNHSKKGDERLKNEMRHYG